MSEFREFWKQRSIGRSQEGESCEDKQTKSSDKVSPDLISKRKLTMAVQEICSWARYPNPGIYNRCCWVVHDDVLAKYNLKNLPLPNKWNYVSKNLSLRSPAAESPLPTVNTPKVNKITKFVRPMPPQTFEAVVSNEGGGKADDDVVIIESPAGNKTRTPSKAIGPMMRFFKPVAPSNVGSPDAANRKRVEVSSCDNPNELLELVNAKNCVGSGKSA